MTQESASSKKTTRSQNLGQTWSQHQTKERPNGHCFHSSKYQLSPQGVQQVTYKGLLNPSSNWLGKESAPRVDLESAPDRKRPNVHCFHSSKYQPSPQGVQQVTYKGLLNPSSNWLGNPNCLITKIPLLARKP